MDVAAWEMPPQLFSISSCEQIEAELHRGDRFLFRVAGFSHRLVQYLGGGGQYRLEHR